MKTTKTTATGIFIGYARDSHTSPWRELVRAASQAEAIQALHAIVGRQSFFSTLELKVVEENKSPD